jgi:hypothetical protein
MGAEQPVASRAIGDRAHRPGPAARAQRGVQLGDLATPVGKGKMSGGWLGHRPVIMHEKGG